LEYNRGRSAADIATSLGVSVRSVFHWIECYAQSFDPSSLRDEPRSGRPPLWSEQQQALLRSLLQTSPDQLGYYALNWTVPLLQEQIERTSGQKLSDWTIRAALHREGYVWKRPRYKLESDPDREKKTRHQENNQEVAS
jgi:transposase